MYKIIYCAIIKISQRRTMPIPYWPEILAELDAFFPHRISIA
ncbi:MAG: hypothetical protein QM520_06705 [Gammaproteobacteria bacterium]|nr:hypothetical protein [Gammaproteobacteria bacterium]